MKSSLSIIFLLGILLSCTEQPRLEEQLGSTSLIVSGSTEAMPHFTKGLLLLHSFEYKDAREAFRKARKVDPNMGMAYWGEAMTFNHPLWREQAYDSAQVVLDLLNQASPDLTDLEEDFLRSIQILYQKDLSKVERDSLYSEYFEKLVAKYPKNDEVETFYALSILGSVDGGRDEVKYEKAGQVALEVVNRNPLHPGALHYVIHSYDDPKHAEKAMDVAYSYAKVAPSASHALHMPSHIFVAKGLWDDVISSNEASYAASVERMKRKGLGNDARGYHAFHWLEYGYLQEGRIEDAKKLVFDLEGYVNETPSKRGRGHMVLLKSTFLAETGNYLDDINEIEVDVLDLNIAIKTRYYTTSGFIAYEKADIDSIESLISIIESECKIAEIFLDTTDFKLCTTITRDSPRRGDIDAAYTFLDQLNFLRAMLMEDRAMAESYVLAAIAKEKELSYSFGPPRIQKPSTELYADWLFDLGQHEEANDYYLQTIQKAPNRRWSMIRLEEIQDLNLSASL